MKYFIFLTLFAFSLPVKNVLTFSDLVKLVDAKDFPEDSYELLENKGFIFYESRNYSDFLNSKDLESIGISKDCKMTQYMKFNCGVIVHSCPPGGVPLSNFDTERFVQVVCQNSSDNYNYLQKKIKKHCSLIKEERHPDLGSMTYTYKHKKKNIYFCVYKFLDDNGMNYFIEVGK